MHNCRLQCAIQSILRVQPYETESGNGKKTELIIKCTQVQKCDRAMRMARYRKYWDVRKHPFISLHSILCKGTTITPRLLNIKKKKEATKSKSADTHREITSHASSPKPKLESNVCVFWRFNAVERDILSATDLRSERMLSWKFNRPKARGTKSFSPNKSD